jgi:hypothetical protein
VIIDLDSADPICPVNVSVQHFYSTLAYFLDWTEEMTGGASSLQILREALLRQDRVPAQELEPFWLNLLDATMDRDLEELAVVMAGFSRSIH